ncbi:MAG: asparagine synthase (glutamine-hydrolyzing), partial [Planctomycetota bacterium]
MCGIAGIFNLDGDPVSGAVVERMSAAIAHRGPDGEGVWSGRGVALGHRRLAIIDPTPAGAQPMVSADRRYVVTYNGEIYNFRELRADLQAEGHRFRTRTDTEVLLAAFAQWGPACVERFNGMFAFAVWDTVERTLFLARDRYGVKPLYYAEVGRDLVFGSEVKALLQHPKMRVRVSPPALNEYFTFQNIFTDRTLFEGVRTLPPGTEQYWDFSFRPDPSISREEAVEETARLFEQAVQRQLVSDVEVGSYLSGGIDSGSIVAVASSAEPRLRTFTGGFDLSNVDGNELFFDERVKAERLSRLYGTDHYQVVVRPTDLEHVLDDVVHQFEDLRVGQCYPNFLVAGL